MPGQVKICVFTQTVQGASSHVFQSPPYAIGIPLGKDGAMDLITLLSPV